MKVQEKFMLDLSEEDAIKQFEALLNDTSYLTVVFDRIHDWFALIFPFACAEALLQGTISSRLRLTSVPAYT